MLYYCFFEAKLNTTTTAYWAALLGLFCYPLLNLNIFSHISTYIYTPCHKVHLSVHVHALVCIHTQTAQMSLFTSQRGVCSDRATDDFTSCVCTALVDRCECVHKTYTTLGHSVITEKKYITELDNKILQKLIHITKQ